MLFKSRNERLVKIILAVRNHIKSSCAEIYDVAGNAWDFKSTLIPRVRLCPIRNWADDDCPKNAI